MTAEDALEQVVGELEDEFDVSTRASMLSATGGVVVLDGSTTLRDLTTQLGWPFPRQPGVETLAGFMLAELGHIPVAGEKIVHEGRIFKVAGMAGRRISRVKVEDKVAQDGETATEDDGLEVSG